MHFYSANFQLLACETYVREQMLSENICYETRKTIDFELVSHYKFFGPTVSLICPEDIFERASICLRIMSTYRNDN